MKRGTYNTSTAVIALWRKLDESLGGLQTVSTTQTTTEGFEEAHSVYVVASSESETKQMPFAPPQPTTQRRGN